jgi:hypothetical protein
MTEVFNVSKDNLRSKEFNSLYDWLQKENNVYVDDDFDEKVDGKEYHITSKWFNPFKSKVYGTRKSLAMYVIHLFKTGLIYDIDELQNKTLGCLTRHAMRYKDGTPACHATVLADIVNRCYLPLETLIERKKEVIESFSKTGTITITFGEQAENHAGMQIIGQGLRGEGLSMEDLQKAQEIFERKGAKTELVTLNDLLPDDVNAPPAGILIVRNGVNIILQGMEMTKYDMMEEQVKLDWDKKAWMRGRVVNKVARFNLVYGDEAQEPDYEDKKGRIIPWKDIPISAYVHNNLGEYFGDKASDLEAEGNYYYDAAKCGIGFHGDSERKIVIALRLGQEIPIHYQWFLRSKPIGRRGQYVVQGGDLYVMSEKATGYDWKRSSILTLRHAAGATKYLTIKKK